MVVLWMKYNSILSSLTEYLISRSESEELLGNGVEDEERNIKQIQK